jgi:hypothetical protein
MRATLSPDAGNPFTAQYEVSPGHPPYSPRARFLGELAGSWSEIGVGLGRRAGDLVRLVSDVWWKSHVETWGEAETRQALPVYEAQVEALDPGLVSFMRGIAEGAGEELDRSPFAEDSSHYQKILNLNVYDSWSWRHPTSVPWRKEATPEPACSSFVTVGSGPNRQVETIAAHNRHCPFNPKCYQVSYVGRPVDGHAFWVLAPAGAGSGCQIVNSRGVSIILNAGGERHGEMRGNAFGVPWFLLFLHLAAHSDTARDAIDTITRGTPAYRANTGRNSLLRTGTWNFLVSDAVECAVVETSCDRYAVRRAGDVGEIGNYLVMTNHNYCDHSYDENNERTDLPMAGFGDETTSPGSAARFRTLMWDIRNSYGRMDRSLAMDVMRGHHGWDRDGNQLKAEAGRSDLRHGAVTCPHGGGPPETWRFGSADSKIAVTGPAARVSWTLGRPCEWSGPWDEVELG